MEQEKKYLYPDGKTPLMKYLSKKMQETLEENEGFDSLSLIMNPDGTTCCVEDSILDLWFEYQDELYRAIDAGEIENPHERAKREAQEREAAEVKNKP